MYQDLNDHIPNQENKEERKIFLPFPVGVKKVNLTLRACPSPREDKNAATAATTENPSLLVVVFFISRLLHS